MIASSQMKLNAKNTIPISSQDHDALGRQGPNSSPNLMKRRGGIGSSSSANHGPGPSQEPRFISKMPPVSVDTVQGSSPEGIANQGNSNLGQHRRDEFLPQLQSGSNNQRSGYGSNKRGNAHHRRQGSRRDHEHGGYDWSGPRGFGGRDSHMLMPLPQQRGQSQPFIRPPPPPTTAPFVGMPPYFRPFMSPMGYPAQSFADNVGLHAHSAGVIANYRAVSLKSTVDGRLREKEEAGEEEEGETCTRALLFPDSPA
ncbi:hypothetical protein BHE74_00039482 [Ensete ventricosum]|nr:hypothetical protein GW17_00005092 [Ensete ventricosum]RWW53968.1 hypothetical protein BHE74_00039482 [Ensete ventricosum]